MTRFTEPVQIRAATVAPPYWQSDYEAIVKRLQNLTQGHAAVFGRSHGGHPLWKVSYGALQAPEHQASYNSALGAHDPLAYKRRAGRKPHVLIIAATHGVEPEGTAALMGLIELLESGEAWPGFLPEDSQALLELIGDVTLTLIPVHNPDGRIRHRDYASVKDLSFDEARYLMQGTWADGSLCGWPEVKAVHPLPPERIGHLGGYFNDGGVNPMHDSFPRMLAPENIALFDLVDSERPDYIVSLHGGTNVTNLFTYTSHASPYNWRHMERISSTVKERSDVAGIPFLDRYASRSFAEHAAQDNLPFNQISALHQFCGAVSVVHECNQGLDIPDSISFTHDEMLQSYGIVFQVLLDHASAHADQELYELS